MSSLLSNSFKVATTVSAGLMMSISGFAGVLLSAPLRAQTGSEVVPVGYTTPIPAELLTPDTVRTSVGTFKFFDGMPDPATVRTTFENLKFIRAYETFLTLMPAASIEMLRHGHTGICLLYTSPSPRDGLLSRMPSSA